MRRTLPAFVLGLVALEVISVVGNAQIVPSIIPMPPSLKTVVVPKPVGIGQFVKDETAAIALGKALFWDMQAGSDAKTACATCHFQAGVDIRSVNQLNSGGNHLFETGGPNHKLTATEYPFHKLADPTNRLSTLLRDRDDVVGSQGVHASAFNDIVPGGSRDDMDMSALDPLGFQVGGLNLRRVTGRNAPSVINAVFNVRNFWDGRASRQFNGRNPFGDADVNARVLKVNDLGELEAVHISLDMASTASQAVGPPLSDVEMSAAGRTFMKLGKKMISLQPLALQQVKNDDSVLGPLAVAGGRGLSTTYADLIRAAFHEQWWNSAQLVDGAMNIIPGATLPVDGSAAPTDAMKGMGGATGVLDGPMAATAAVASALPTNQYTLMESNFSLFWGLAIAAYEATLVSDDAPYDRFKEGNTTALTQQQKIGMRVFSGLDGGNCLGCHAGPEFTGAAISARLDPATKDGMLERMIIADRLPSVYDGGFYNIGVRRTTDDIGLGANDPFGNPLSMARQEQLHPGSVRDNMLFPPMDPFERINADGCFKTPSLRNIELTGPYFHNGGEASLQDVVAFYARGGNFHDENLANLDADMERMRGLLGYPNRQIALLSFLRGLTDERVRWYRAPFDHPELVLPNGAQGNEVSVLQDLTVSGPAADAIMRLPATGRSGATTPVRAFLNLPVFSATTLPAPEPTLGALTLFATDSITITSRMDLEGDIWCNGGVRVASRMGHSMHADITAGPGGIQISGDSLEIAGNLMAKGPITLSPLTFMDGFAAPNAEFYAPLAMPALPALPVLPLIRTSVNVPAYGVETLTPGKYGTLLIGTGGWVILQPGTYVFSRISLGIGAYLQYDPDGQVDQPVGIAGEMPIGNLATVIIHTDNLDMARGAIIAQGDAMMTTHLRMYVRASGAYVKLSPEGYFHGSLIAPTARVVLMNGSTLVGAAYSRTIEVAETAMFESHTLAELPRPGGIGFGAVTAGPPNPDDVAAPVSLGLAFELGQNSPNPFRPSTTIRFALPAQRDVELRVFDVTGRAVKTLAQGAMGPGVHTLQWNGDDDHGSRLSSGVYFYRLTAGTDRAQRKMVIVE